MRSCQVQPTSSPLSEGTPGRVTPLSRPLPPGEVRVKGFKLTRHSGVERPLQVPRFDPHSPRMPTVVPGRLDAIRMTLDSERTEYQRVAPNGQDETLARNGGLHETRRHSGSRWSFLGCRDSSARSRNAGPHAEGGAGNDCGLAGDDGQPRGISR